MKLTATAVNSRGRYTGPHLRRKPMFARPTIPVSDSHADSHHGGLACTRADTGGIDEALIEPKVNSGGRVGCLKSVEFETEGGHGRLGGARHR